MNVALLAWLSIAQALTPDVIEHAQAGAQAMKAGKFDEAIREFLAVTAAQPEGASGHANLGEAYFQSHQFELAMPELERALEINPQMMGTHQTLGVALLVEGNAADAIPHLEKNRTPELLGLAYLETGRLGSAIVALQGALERQPNDPDILYYFGRATRLAGQRVQEHLKSMGSQGHVEDGPPVKTDIDPVREVVRIQTELARQPDDAQLLTDFHRQAELASAQAFDRIAPGSARAHQVAAERLAASGRLPEAEKEYAEAVRLKPYTPDLHLEFGKLLAAEGNGPGAIEQFGQETLIRPLSAENWYRLGSALLGHGRARDAEVVLNRADQLRPNTPRILLTLGQASFDGNDAAHAEQAWKKLIELDGKSELASQAHYGLAAVYRGAGKSQEAQHEMDAYRELKGRREN